MWTNEKPQKEGYYWVQTKGILSGKDYIHPVRAYCSKKDGAVDTVFSDGENFSIESDMFIRWWSEEITRPVGITIPQCLHCGTVVNIILDDRCPNCKNKL